MLVNLRCFGVAEFATGTDSREFRLCIVVIFPLCLALSKQKEQISKSSTEENQYHYFHLIS